MSEPDSPARRAAGRVLLGTCGFLLGAVGAATVRRGESRRPGRRLPAPPGPPVVPSEVAGGEVLDDPLTRLRRGAGRTRGGRHGGVS
ncbi:MAG TPA: hypothetical protein VHC41_06795 [Mycobacteriales bacterium]|jgi:hypothetical protein|nr:hypothetical protein [Mycobacteriales bacterium]